MNTQVNPTLLPQGYARISRNLLHNQGQDCAKLRNGVTRINHTRLANSSVFALYEFTNNSGTSTRLAATNSGVYSYSISIPGSLTLIDGSHQNAAISRFSQALNFWLQADARDNNYIGNGTAGYPFQVAAPTTAHTLPLSGTGITGTYRYTYARYSTITGELSPAYDSTTDYVSATPANQTVTFTLTLAATEQFDQIQIYRTKTGGVAFYELTKVNAGSPATYADTTADSALVTLSTLHTTAGAINTDRPAAATDVFFHRGRTHLIGLSGSRSRQRWSQLNSFSFDSTTTARHDVEPDDGDFLVRGFSYDGTIVLFKEHSIHLMNGDVNELSFTWQVACDRNTGIGAYCPFTAVATPIGIIFQGECGVYLYRPGMSRPQLISSSIQPEIDGLDYSYRALFTACYDPCERAYLISVTPTGQTTNTHTYVFFIDTGYWSEWRYGNGNISVAGWSQNHMHNSTSRQKAFFGSDDGYIYETDTSGGNDGIISGTESGTLTGGSDTTAVDSGAAFYTTGNGLLGLSVTVSSAASAYETQEISSNTGTTLTTGSWTVDPASGYSYYVGAIEGVLSLGRIDVGTAGYKRFVRLSFEFQSQTHSIPLLLGYTMDGDTEPTTSTSITQSGIFRASIIVNRIGVGLSPYIRCIGVDNSFEILKIEIDYHELTGRLPRN